MKYIAMPLILLLSVCWVQPLQAACSKDHISVGCNFDGEPNTLDDSRLYLDVSKKYRHSTLPDNGAVDDFTNWYYPIPLGFGNKYLLGEPGLDFVSDPNQRPQADFDLKIQCLALSDGLTVLDAAMQPLIEQSGQIVDYTTTQAGAHVHWNFQAAGNTQTQWFTFYIYDALGNYSPSEPCTLVFCRPPIPGDIHVDGKVDLGDAEKLAAAWLADREGAPVTADGRAALDFFDGADINRDYRIDLRDFAEMAQHWLAP